MDAVYVVRRGNENRELRYSLRSVQAHLPHDRVWIAGYKPFELTGVGYLPVERVGSSYDNSRANLIAACRSAEVSDPFVMLNDDFFLLAPCPQVPVLHRGTITDVVGDGRRSPYAEGLVATGHLLCSWGFPDPLSYEIHIPIVLHKAAVLEIAERVQVPGPRNIYALGFRSLIGNVFGFGGTWAQDVKITKLDEAIPDNAAFVSSSDYSFRKGLVGKQVRVRFPDPSPYERSVPG